jgi:formate-dependent phosphoribosylglycinamide formyltransferase (GAR transformylase)
MEPIRVPAPSPSSFNKHRPPSDLLLSQLKYFHHLDEKHDLGVDPSFAKDIGTEAGAARYITQMTRAIRAKAFAAGKGTVAGAGPALKLVAKPSAAASRRSGIALAAAAETPKGKSRSSATKGSPKPRKGKKP